MTAAVVRRDGVSRTVENILRRVQPGFERCSNRRYHPAGRQELPVTHEVEQAYPVPASRLAPGRKVRRTRYLLLCTPCAEKFARRRGLDMPPV